MSIYGSFISFIKQEFSTLTFAKYLLGDNDFLKNNSFLAEIAYFAGGAYVKSTSTETTNIGDTEGDFI